MKVLGNRIIIEVDKEPEQTHAGLFKPESATKAYKVGKVVEVGPGEKGTPMDVKVGDTIYVQKHAGTEIEIDDKEYTVVSQIDVLVVL